MEMQIRQMSDVTYVPFLIWRSNKRLPKGLKRRVRSNKVRHFCKGALDTLPTTLDLLRRLYLSTQ